MTNIPSCAYLRALNFHCHLQISRQGPNLAIRNKDWGEKEAETPSKHDYLERLCQGPYSSGYLGHLEYCESLNKK